MLDNLISWHTAIMIVVSILATHAGIKAINKLFDKNNKKNSLF